MLDALWFEPDIQADAKDFAMVYSNSGLYISCMNNIPSNVLKSFPRVIHDYERKTTLTLHITNTHDALTSLSVADLNENFVSTHI